MTKKLAPELDKRSVTASELVGERLKAVRQVRGWSAKQLAERCAAIGAARLSAFVIANIETKRKQVSIDDVLALAYACDISPGDLLTLPDEQTDLALADRVKVDEAVALQRWWRGESPLEGMDEALFATDGRVGARIADADYGRALLLAGSKRLIAQYDARAEEFLSATRQQVRDVIGDLRQAVTHNVDSEDLLGFLDQVEADLKPQESDHPQ